MLKAHWSIKRFTIRIVCLGLFLFTADFVCGGNPTDKIDFNRDIRPILSDKCFFCHGPDENHRKARLRLDTRSGAVDDGEVVVPGKSADSELFRRLITAEEFERMPPKKSGKTLKAEEITLIRRWIDEGAEYQTHWSFSPPKRPALPTVKNKKWIRNPIDAFVLAKLEQENLQPATETDRRRLLRRVSLDLTGLPPTVEEMEQFLKDDSEYAYEKAVDRLLQSPHYGERMAMVWLDAARYSDTDGFQADATRSNWPWRDWVVQAYNRNLPFDEFTIQQFAGDLLPDASKETILATCFHRNHMTNGEGGRDPEESRIDYVMDRVNTMGTAWLGLTVGCAQCHNHRYDPLSQKEYYQLFAFFNSIDEDGRAGGGAKPFLPYQSDKLTAHLKDSRAWLTLQEQQLQKVRQNATDVFQKWLQQQTSKVQASNDYQSWREFRGKELTTTHNGTTLTQNKNQEFVVNGDNPRHDDYRVVIRPSLTRVTGFRLQVLPQGDGKKSLSLANDGHVILTNVKVFVRNPRQSQIKEIAIASVVADHEGKSNEAKNYGPINGVLDDDPRTGWYTGGKSSGEMRQAQFAFADPVVLNEHDEFIVELWHRSLRGNSSIRRFRLAWTDESGPMLRRFAKSFLEQLAEQKSDGKDLPATLQQNLFTQFLADYQPFQQATAAVNQAKQRLQNYERASRSVNVMVLKERAKPRPSYVLKRGVWDQQGEKVTRGVPAALSPWPKDASKDRLGLARWLVSRDNPLTARVTVNRYWQMYFGAGLVRTPEDFGAQGEPPTHPDLLDWLAVEFMERNWDIKHMQRLIVTSATYRQSSDVDDELYKRDPDNRLLARASRFRLPSWMIRDAALASSGLLKRTLGGPPVFPYQPSGIWAESTMGRFHYQTSAGSDLYRRSLYTFWRRSVAPTAMFDAPARRVCQVRVTRTNTPLQALTLMNDHGYIEAARVLAQKILVNGIDKRSDLDRMQTLMSTILSRPGADEEVALLTRQLAKARQHYQDHADDAKKLLAYGSAPVPDTINRSELAAWTVVAMTIFNLDEAITRE